MKIQVNQLDSCKTEVAVEVEANLCKEDYEVVCRKYILQSRVPGFRPGKAPRNVVQQRYRDSIQSDFVEGAIRKYLQEAIKTESLSPISPPQVTDVNFSEGKPLIFKASFEVLPPIEISKYKGLEVEQVSTDVSKEEIEKALKQLQERMAEYLPIEDRAAQLGDHVVISINGQHSSRNQEKINEKEVYCELGGDDTPKEFNENLTGSNPGDIKTFQVKYSEDHQNKSLAGQEIQYSVEVKAIKQKQLPKLNDDFAKNAGDYSSLEDLRDKILANYVEQKKTAADSEMQSKLMEKIIADSPFDVPEIMVKEQLNARLNEYMQTLMMQGIDPKTLNLDWQTIQDQQRDQAVHDVKVALVLEWIGEKEKVTISEKEVEEEIERIAQGADQSVETLKSRLTKDGATDRIRTGLQKKKSLDLVLSLASVKSPRGNTAQSQN
ncbi:MAG: trigger factor [Acidobacteriia bacterium]|nr:trigger factor [Terriglobia bacterium]